MFSIFKSAFSFGRKIILSLILSLRSLLILGQATPDTRGNAPVPYTLADRERSIKLEARLAAFQNETKLRFDGVQKDIDGLKAEFSTLRSDVNTLRNDVGTLRGDIMVLFMWGFGLLFSSIIGLIGFIIWDRRSSNREIMEKVQANQARIESVERKLVFKP